MFQMPEALGTGCRALAACERIYELFGLIALLSLVILLGGYIAENWFSSKWSGLQQANDAG